jgi:transposase-like protein
VAAAHRDTESATAFFRQVLARTGWRPTLVISDHHQPSVKAVQEVLPETAHGRTGLHRARGETTKPIARSHVVTRDRLRASRGLKTLVTGQRFCEGFEGFLVLRRGHTRRGHTRRGHTRLAELVPGYDPAQATVHEHVHAVAHAATVLVAGLRKEAGRAV